MIAHVNGKLVSKSTDAVVVDVGGVGYEVLIPLSTFYRLPDAGRPVTLKTHTHLKDGSIELYGFLSTEEKDLFQMLLGVSGVGPRLARNILSGISVQDLVSAVAGNDLAAVNSVPGVGAKTAQRLVLELKDKVRKIAKSAAGDTIHDIKDHLTDDVVSALNNLGYKNAPAEEAVKKARSKFEKSPVFEDLFKTSLKILASK